jgi:hypothetical protein
VAALRRPQARPPGGARPLRRLLRGGEVFELCDLGRHAAALLARDGDELLALGGERRERVFHLAFLAHRVVQHGPFAFEIRASFRHVAFGGTSLSHGLFVRRDQVANVLPALGEIVERRRREEDVDVPEVAALVRVDEPPFERVVVTGEGRFGRVELHLVPCEMPLVSPHPRVDRIERGRDVGDVVVRLAELADEIRLALLLEVEFHALVVETLVKPVDRRLCGVDLVAEARAGGYRRHGDRAGESE